MVNIIISRSTKYPLFSEMNINNVCRNDIGELCEIFAINLVRDEVSFSQILSFIRCLIFEAPKLNKLKREHRAALTD